MKKLIAVIDVENCYEDFLFSGGVIKTKEDEELFLQEYNFTLAELERMEGYSHSEYDPYAKHDLDERLGELNKMAENNGYEIEIDFDVFQR